LKVAGPGKPVFMCSNIHVCDIVCIIVYDLACLTKIKTHRAGTISKFNVKIHAFISLTKGHLQKQFCHLLPFVNVPIYLTLIH
jgi:hypothetical protein